jgi:protein-tyrosine phosphatase
MNASPIDLGSKNETFIATQGPLKDEIGRFWRLVWQEGCEVIVMLTQPYEKGREMCAVYYPEKVDEVVMEDTGISVECLTFVKESGTEVRKLKLVKEGEERVVWHLFYPNWLDMTATQQKDQTELLSLIKMSRFRIDAGRAGQEQGISRPRLVHCSAGIGRTGTFIALDSLLQDIGKWKKGNLEMDDPVFETVKRLREQRMRMVYTKEQYASIYQMLGDHWDTWEGYLGNIYNVPSIC